MPYPWSVNDVLTASDLNAAIGTGIVSTGLSAWTAYTPTWSGTLGNGTIVGAYCKVGRMVTFRVGLTWGSTSSHGATAQTFTVPTAMVAAASGTWIGGARIVDSSAGAPFMRQMYLGGSTVAFLTEAGTFVTNLLPMTWATGDSLQCIGTYESAT